MRNNPPAQSDADKEPLIQLLKGNLESKIALRANIVLAFLNGMKKTQVIARLGVTRPTLDKWIKRYEERGVEGLQDVPPPGRKRSRRTEEIEKIIMKTAEGKPTKDKGWTLRTLYKALPKNSLISLSIVYKVWKGR